MEAAGVGRSVPPPRPRGGWTIRLLERLGGLGDSADTSSDDTLRHGTLILASSVITVISTVWVVSYLVFDRPLSASIPAAYQVATVVGLVLVVRTHDFVAFRRTQLTLFLVLPALLQLSLGGFVASSAMILWSVLVPLAALALLGLRRSLPWLAAFLGTVLGLALLDPLVSRDPAQLPADLVTAFIVLNLFGLTIATYSMLAYFVEQRERARLALEAERQRSERLLLNVLPASIAERLKAEPSVIAEYYHSVTVLFADLVGFTEQTLVIPPEQLVLLLDRIFSAFDQDADGAGVEKIKTIGDAYMVAGGVPERRPDHVDAVVSCALAMREHIAAIATEPGMGWLAVRIGIDTGPAVAGVVGRRKFIYDLWGDTVNTASRMQSLGVAGEIQVTDRVVAALGTSRRFRARGTILVKGKGPMATHFLDE